MALPRHRPAPGRLFRSLLGVAALALLASCAENAPLDTLDPAGPRARSIHNLNALVFPVAGVIGLIVIAAVVFVVVRYKERPDDDTVPSQVHGNTKLEVAWTLAPAILLAGIAVPTIATVFSLAREPKGEVLQINVYGQQWWWEFDYPGLGIVTANDMVIPEDTEVKVNITSRDVIHSFWVPRLNGKRDAVPGRIHTLTLKADDPGEYWGHCTEFCGLSHANMRMRSTVLTKDQFAAWVANQQKPAVDPNTAPAESRDVVLSGAQVFAVQCASCHQINGLRDQIDNVPPARPVPQVAGAAPNLTHLMSRTVFAGAMFNLKDPECTAAPPGPTGTPVECLNRAQLESWLRDPGALKPMQYQPVNGRGGNRGMPNLNLTEEQIDQLVEYLSTLK